MHWRLGASAQCLAIPAEIDAEVVIQSRVVRSVRGPELGRGGGGHWWMAHDTGQTNPRRDLRAESQEFERLPDGAGRLMKVGIGIEHEKLFARKDLVEVAELI